MTRAKYFTLLMRQPTEWLKTNLENPSIYMRKRHLDLIRLVFQIIPRPGIQRRFTQGEIVFSQTSGQRVRVVEVSDCGRWFDGVYIGNRRFCELPHQFHYRWNGWRCSNFKPE